MEKDDGHLSKTQKITIAVTIAIFILGAIIQILFKVWYSPDIRYEIGSYYILKSQAVVSCVLRNYGHKTANSIRVPVNFKTNILDLQITPFTKYGTLEGGINQKDLVIEIERLVPSSQVTIFYAIEQPQEEKFIDKIEYDSNVAKQGKPILWSLLPILILYSLLPFIMWWLRKLRLPFFDKQIDKFYANIDEVVRLAYEMKQQNKTKEDLEKIFEQKFKNISFRKESLKKIAKSIFKNAQVDSKEDEVPF